MDVRQGRVRRAGGRDGPRPSPSPGCAGFGTYARAHDWTAPQGRNLLGARVTILGGGGITESLVRLLQPWDCHITVVRRTANHLDGVDDVLEADRYADALPGADLVVLALALTPETEGIIAADELSLMEDHAWLVNVARGRHVVTDDLVDALRDGVIGGAGLDVTDPEPLPHDHPLWTMPNCLITPHVGNTPAMARPLLAERIRLNVRRFADGRGADRPDRRRRRVLTWPARRGRSSTPAPSSACSPTTSGAGSSPRSILGASSADEVADALRPAAGRATRALGRLVDAGLVVAVPTAGLDVDGDAFQRAARVARPRPSQRRARRRAGRAPQGAGRVRPRRPHHVDAGGARQAARGARLAGPGVRAGRALHRARGQRHPRRAPPGHGGVRRYLVDEGMLDRAGGEYWRSGGSVT